MDDIRELKRRMLKALNEETLEQNPTDQEQGGTVDKEVKDLTVRDMLKLTRNDVAGKKKVDDSNIQQKISPSEEKKEQEKFQSFFENNNVIIDFRPLQLYSHSVFWGGTIDGQVQWIFKVTPYEESSGVDINILEGFQKDDPENEEIIKKLENYYGTFYKYWRDNEVE